MRLFLSLCSKAKPIGANVINELVDRYAVFHPSPLSLERFISFGVNSGCEKTSFLFLRKELPVRLANIMKEINLLPDQLLLTPSVQVVEGWYEQSFQEILQYEKSDPKDSSILEYFTESLVKIRNRHSSVVETMAQGVIEMKEDKNCPIGPLEKQVQYFLDRFYMSRISIRMLINQHTLLFDPEHHQSSKHIGAIDPACRVQDVAQDAYENARFLCEQYYLASPDCVFESVDPYGSKEGSLTVTYVPSHLYHILFELFKNALRAVVETHGQEDTLPDIKVMICKGKEDLTIKIHDEGGGISRSQLPLLFNYMYSTAPRPPGPAAASSTPLAGYGYGLPLSRLYAKYFLGDLHLSSVEGYGTDAYVNIKVFPDDASELLPVYNKTSSAKYHVSQSVSDWSDPLHSGGLHSRNYCTLSSSRNRTLKRKS